jgi:HEAT repeat protein
MPVLYGIPRRRAAGIQSRQVLRREVAMSGQRAAGAAGLAALLVLGCRSQPPAPDVHQLITQLKSSDRGQSGEASLALIRIGEPAVPPLVEMLQSEDPRLRKTAATTLYGFGAKGRAAVPALAPLLEDPDRSLRLSAAMALDNMGPAAAEAVPALIHALGDRDGEVRQWSAKALGHIGPAAASAIPALARSARNDPLRPTMEEAIRQIRGQ